MERTRQVGVARFAHRTGKRRRREAPNPPAPFPQGKGENRGYRATANRRRQSPGARKNPATHVAGSPEICARVLPLPLREGGRGVRCFYFLSSSAMSLRISSSVSASPETT